MNSLLNTLHKLVRMTGSNVNWQSKLVRARVLAYHTSTPEFEIVILSCAFRCLFTSHIVSAVFDDAFPAIALDSHLFPIMATVAHNFVLSSHAHPPLLIAPTTSTVTAAQVQIYASHGQWLTHSQNNTP